MQYPLAVLSDIGSSRHPAHTTRRTIALLWFWIVLAAMTAFYASPARGGESI